MPGRAWWLLDGHLNGHTIEETIFYAGLVEEATDRARVERDREYTVRGGVIAASAGIDLGPRWPGRLRRWLGR